MMVRRKIIFEWFSVFYAKSLRSPQNFAFSCKIIILRNLAFKIFLVVNLHCCVPLRNLAFSYKTFLFSL